ncbi:cysteine-rich receptor-like protein kinase 26 [Quercus lobata]|uniref:cysteine-rich receptor-like protein kinase 26 n=1 Tax=Quercus lobata TaxID=97700 RepID=UPI001243F20D|nr:cysteine-rich receptor-like protein kinase 26 [Quercus lobata]
MCNSSLITITLAFLISLSLCLPLAQPEPCSNTGTFSTNSTYANYLNLLLSSLPSNVTANGGFYNTSSGQDPNKVYALALCRGDLDTGKCYTCTNTSSLDITKQCPDQKEAIIWGGECILRYSNRNIFGTMEVLPSQCVPNPNKISSTDLDQFNQTLYNLMGSLRTQASLDSSSIKYFAVGDKSFSSSRNVYGLVQCTPDISQMDCRICLEGAVADISSCSGGKEGGRVLKPSCIAWFEVFQFYDSTFVPSSPTTTVIPPTSDNSSPTTPAIPPTSDNFSPPKTRRENSSTSHLVIFVVVPIAGLMTVITLAWAILQKKKSKQNVDNDDATKRLEALKFNFNTIKAATNNFSNANKIGEGGFGSVYKARLPNGQEFAVKRLFHKTEHTEEQFKNEILLVAKLQHKCLVSLQGFCSEGRERILIYELVGNGSLDQFIYDPIKRAQMNWERRYDIICSIARGILYLHEDSHLKIIHRDLKPSNILFDEAMNPKISDFGLARLFDVGQSQDKTSRRVGTYGYMAPEYISHGHYSVKSDVFSFGILVLEIVSGRKKSWLCNTDDVELLLSYAWTNWREGTASNLIDQTLGDGSRSEITRCIHIGLLCVQENVAYRPTMSLVVQMLNSDSSSLPTPARPAFLIHSDIERDITLLQSTSGASKSK